MRGQGDKQPSNKAKDAAKLLNGSLRAKFSTEVSTKKATNDLSNIETTGYYE